MFPNLPCLKCTEVGTVFLHLDDFTFGCRECENTWTQDEARDALKQWNAVLQWTAAARVCEEVS